MDEKIKMKADKGDKSILLAMIIVGILGSLFVGIIHIPLGIFIFIFFSIMIIAALYLIRLPSESQKNKSDKNEN